MGFFEKVKNMFTEEVEDDVKVEQIKKEVTHVAIESPNAKKDDDFEEQVIENFEFKEEINKPVFFDDNDFRDLNLTKKEEPKKEEIKQEKEIYGNKLASEEVKEKKVFKPTPIISPVYGVLDKNYHKEDIVSRQDVKTKEVEIDAIDTIRNKAYGTLEDELENTLFGNNSILFKREEEEEKIKFTDVSDDILTNLTDDISKELDELLIKKERYIEDDEEINTNINEDDEKINTNINEDDLLDFIDSTLYKEGDEE